MCGEDGWGNDCNERVYYMAVWMRGIQQSGRRVSYACVEYVDDVGLRLS